MKAYKKAIKNALAKGYTVSVWDTEEWQVKRSTKYTEIVAACESTDLVNLRIRDAAGEYIGTIAVTPYEADDETICDYTLSDKLEEIIP